MSHGKSEGGFHGSERGDGQNAGVKRDGRTKGRPREPARPPQGPERLSRRPGPGVSVPFSPQSCSHAIRQNQSTDGQGHGNTDNTRA